MVRKVMEVIALSLEDVVIAEDNGADRIELACGLAEGALTPSYGFMKQARHLSSIPIFAMIRPRHGDFCYDPAEIMVMARDISVAKECGLDGVVLGVLNSKGQVAMDVLAELLAVSDPLPVTFHRAFDSTPDPFAALSQLLKFASVTRILTSGQADSALLGVGRIRELQNKAGRKITIMPGVGLTPETVARITCLSGAREVHLGTGLRTPEGNLGKLDKIKVRAARLALDQLG